VRSFKGPARDYDLTLARLAQVPRRRDFAWVALAAFLGGVACATLLTALFWH